MKKTTTKKLALTTQTLVALTSAELDGAHGGFGQRTENCTNTSIPCQPPPTFRNCTR